MANPWYEKVASDTSLTQGDLISDCPLIGWASDSLEREHLDDAEVLKTATTAVRADVAVMTQACDLEQERVANVIVCPHVSLGEHRTLWQETMREKNQNPTEKAWRSYCDDIRDGFNWNLTLLNAGDAEGLQTEHRIVDFHEVFTVPRSFIESLLLQRADPRLRLLPPYREHLSQSFARFFMRVGLPVPVDRVW